MYGHANPTIRSTEDGDRVGPRMHRAVVAVGSGAYASRNQLAQTVGPNGSQQYGYQIVNRCVGKNLLALDPSHEMATPQGQGAVILTDKGARYLNEHTDADLDPDDYVDHRAHYSSLSEEWVVR